MKIFHYMDKIDSLPADRDTILPPTHIRIKPTNVCGHNCWYCAYKSSDLQLGKDMNERDFIPREKMIEIINDLDDMDVKAVTFSGGGDPFYYPHLAEAIKKLSETEIAFAALSNGSRLKGEIAELFSTYGTWLRISLDGWDDKSYSEYRGVKEGEFTRVMENIRNFKRLSGSCYLGAVVIVDHKNASHVYELISMLQDAGADSVKISPGIVNNNGEENNEYHRRIFDSVKTQSKEAVEKMARNGFEIFDSYHLLDDKFKKDYSWCPYIQILPIIGADQNVYSCQDKAYNLDCGLIGSIRDQSFKSFWFSGKEKFFTIDPSRHCDHHCVSNSKNRLIIDYLNSDEKHLGFV